MKLNHQQKGFTLIEMLVVISIIVLIAGITIPSIAGFMEERRLRSASAIVQGACMQARSRAISQREKQYVLFFAQAGDVTPTAGSGWNGGTISGQPSTILLFDANTGNDTADAATQADNYEQVEAQQLPEFVSFQTPAINFVLVFSPDGTVEFDLNITNKDNDPEPADPKSQASVDIANNTDIVISQTGTNLRCYVDIIRNTGRVNLSRPRLPTATP